MAERTPVFTCDIEPISAEWSDSCSHKYAVDIDASFSYHQHTVTTCPFACSKIYDSSGNVIELRDLLHHNTIQYDWRKVANLFLNIVADKYREAGEFLEATVIPVELRFNPHQLIGIEITNCIGKKKSS